MATNEGDIVLDSFLGSGTTAAVANKMDRRWIGIEIGDQAYTHSKVRLDRVIYGVDHGGITNQVNWRGGGGYRFYEIDPSLIGNNMYSTDAVYKLIYNEHEDNCNSANQNEVNETLTIPKRKRLF